MYTLLEHHGDFTAAARELARQGYGQSNGDMTEHLEKRQLWANGFFARFALVGSDDVGVWRFWPEPLAYPPDLVKGFSNCIF